MAASLPDSTLLLPCVCLLVDNMEHMGKFLSDVFEGQMSVNLHPIRYGVVQLSDKASVILIQKNGCDDTLLLKFGLLSVNQVQLSRIVFVFKFLSSLSSFHETHPLARIKIDIRCGKRSFQSTAARDACRGPSAVQ